MRDTRASRVYVHCISLVEKERFRGGAIATSDAAREDAGEVQSAGASSVAVEQRESLAVPVRERDASGAMVDDAVGDGPDDVVLCQ